MNRTVRTALAGVAAVPVALLAPTAALAAPAQHEVYVEDWAGSFLRPAEENPCGSFAARFFEERSGSYDIVVPQNGEVHVNGVVHGDLRIVPSDPSLPTYTGSYREKANVVVIGIDEATGEDITRVGQFRLRLPLEGSDGSELLYVLSGKVTLKRSGEAVVERQSESCTERRTRAAGSREG